MSADAAARNADSSDAVRLRRARLGDVPAIVAMLADDPLGAGREQAGELAGYEAAFHRIDQDASELLVVAELGGEVVGTLQLSLLPGLSHGGSTRAQIEAVRVARPHRGHGIGAEMIRWAIERARMQGCAVVQLTSNTSRTEAHRFYARLGFTASHTGFKLPL